MLEKNELEEILNKAGFGKFKNHNHSSYTTAEIKTTPIPTNPKGAGRKPKEVKNPYIQDFINLVGDRLPQWLDDVIYGAGTHHAGSNTRVPLRTLRALLQSMDVFTVESIRESLNRRSAIDGKEVGERYAQSVLRSLESAIKSIEYHLERNKSFYSL
ncbi:hypothetical protein INE66_004559 [Salmonella enterica subsp. enterica]|nr:hypothetical protein [Salmonella enterica subsp. enterica]